ncbi:PREDICTED: uncharacterized protein LOC106817251 [Priapulus caudatus]|uniref:Uncharacterized protein LOC106817251 n=1 Tax=Priapulus caudatus TaxID=37621 RepID=A0ABM1EYX9_PRICU|nr:PREDICTED: uncharacterized protein LOC106817251 [Priapulus caudatus]
MRVNLAAQVLSYSVGRLLQANSGEEAQETAKFVLLMDRFFDCLNVRSHNEAERKRKPDLLPFRNADDARFHFLEHEFLGYVNEWANAAATRPGNYTKAARNAMFLSQQTSEGLWMTVHSVIEATRYLLNNGVEFVFTNVFCQDPIEEHFGRHRGLGRRCDNPNLWTFGYQENKIRMQRSLAHAFYSRGNVTSHMKRQRLSAISNSPLKNCKRK